MSQGLTYKLAQCCSPNVRDEIIGYFKADGTIAIHKRHCQTIGRVPQDRLLQVTWQEIQSSADGAEPEPTDPAFGELDRTDYRILKHHQELGIDYSIVVAETLGIPREEAFARHRKLRQQGALKRVEKLIVQYRKNIVKGKWIKHRNHTYYELTSKGETWIRWFEQGKGSPTDDESMPKPQR